MDPLSFDFPLKEIKSNTKMPLSDEEGQVWSDLVFKALLSPTVRALYSLGRVEGAEAWYWKIKQSLFRYLINNLLSYL